MSQVVKQLRHEDYEVNKKGLRAVSLTELGRSPCGGTAGYRDPDLPEDITPEQALCWVIWNRRCVPSIYPAQ